MTSKDQLRTPSVKRSGIVPARKSLLFVDTVLTLREISRTLRPGAPLAIITVTSASGGLLRFRRILNYGRRQGLRVFDVPALEQILGEAGFETAIPKPLAPY